MSTRQSWCEWASDNIRIYHDDDEHCLARVFWCLPFLPSGQVSYANVLEVDDDDDGGGYDRVVVVIMQITENSKTLIEQDGKMEGTRWWL